MIQFSRGGNAFAGLRLASKMALGYFLLSNCSAPPQATVAPASAPARAQRGAVRVPGSDTARWLRLPEEGSANLAEVLSDGTRHLITDGMRVAETPDGRWKHAAQLLPASSVKTLSLPPWLGGGHVFYGDVERETWIWRSAEWAGPLTPLARVEPSILQIVAGFDRLYLLGRPQHELRAIDPESGQALDLGSLPKSPSFGALAFATPWLAAANTDIRGLLVTFDAGNSWRPLGLSENNLQLTDAGNALLISTQHDRFRLNEQGELTQQQADPLERDQTDELGHAQQGSPDDVQGRAARNLPTAGRQELPLGGTALPITLLHGFKESHDTAIAAANGTLARVRLSDGSILRQRSNAYLGRARCDALSMGSGYGFVCGTETGSTSLYRYNPHFSLEHLVTFSRPRKIAASGSAGVLIRGECAQSSQDSAESGTYCLYSKGALDEVRLPRGAAHPVGLLDDGTVVSLWPPTANMGGFLTVTRAPGARAAARRVIPLRVAGLSGEQRAFLQTGKWLESMNESGPTELSTWVVGAQQFAGVRIHWDGSVELGALRSDPAHALLNGAIGVVLTAGGIGYETSNQGFDWAAFKIPAALGSLDPHAEFPLVHAGETLGCSSMGCVLGRWVRVGFGAKQVGLAEGAQPAALAHRSGGVAYWAMDCAATGSWVGVPARVRLPRPSGESRPVHARVVSARPQPAPLQSSAWRGFLGQSAPRRAPDELGLDAGSDDRRIQFRGYVWGPPDARWAGSARWLLRVADRFDVDAVWSTRPSRVPWGDPNLAAQSFGQALHYVSTADWAMTLDSSGTAGLLRLRERSANELYLIEKDRPILRVVLASDPAGQDLAGLASVADRWYWGTQASGVFHVYQLEEGVATLLGSYPQLASESVRTQLVRSRNSDALAIWIKSPALGWFFFPLDLHDGSVSTPTHVATRDLSGVPPACSPAAEGWEVVADAPLATLGGSAINVSMSFSSTLANLRAHQVEARVVASDRGICVRDIAAQLEESSITPTRIEPEARAQGKPVPMVLTDRASERRLGFRCSR